VGQASEVQEGGKSFRVNRDCRGSRARFKRDQTVPFEVDQHRAIEGYAAPKGVDRALVRKTITLAICRPCGTGIVLPLPRGVTVAQVTLDHFVMVRIHARQPSQNEALTQSGSDPEKQCVAKVWPVLKP
jgi:hypothetical protein